MNAILNVKAAGKENLCVATVHLRDFQNGIRQPGLVCTAITQTNCARGLCSLAGLQTVSRNERLLWNV